MNFALEVRQRSEVVGAFAAKLRAAIASAGGKVVEDDGERPDLVLAVGGDGTVLAAAQRALTNDVPILGFNLGTMGFLAEAEPTDLDQVITRLLAGDYDVSERMTVKATIDHASVTGVNDVVVEKVDSQRLIHLDVSVDDERFLTYRADGLIVATPTGSTAYSFSARGPIVSPDVACLIVTPIAAHMVFDRSFVLGAKRVVSLEVVGDEPGLVSADGRETQEIPVGAEVRIRASNRPARLVRRDDAPGFLSRVRDKFDLPGDPSETPSGISMHAGDVGGPR